jgi:hypothetical protein
MFVARDFSPLHIFTAKPAQTAQNMATVLCALPSQA